jgi:hypothetical protein
MAHRPGKPAADSSQSQEHAKKQAKEQALADARKATARLRRSNEKARRYQSGKQDNPVEQMTPNQWLGGAGS